MSSISIRNEMSSISIGIKNAVSGLSVVYTQGRERVESIVLRI
jgi:hypothetical protein